MPFQKGGVNPSASAVKELASMNLQLQKVVVQLVEKMNGVTTRLDRMLSLFEDAAKNINTTDDASALKTQLQDLLEQNKTIARGLLSIEKYMRNQPATPSPFPQRTGYQ